MFKSPLTAWLLATTFVFAAWLNVVHGYEHDEHEQHSHEQDSEACKICFLLSKLSDPIQIAPNSSINHPIAEEHYFFILKNNYASASQIVNSRAPPQVNKPT